MKYDTAQAVRGRLARALDQTADARVRLKNARQHLHESAELPLEDLLVAQHLLERAQRVLRRAIEPPEEEDQ